MKQLAMHRLRKKSETKTNQVPEEFRPRFRVAEALPTLPSEDNFRTSLILPDLTRRFSVLRTTSGTPIGIDDLKSKFAEQRARGSRNQVSEEEEDMILEALGRLNIRSVRSRTSSGDDGEATQTERSTTSTLRNAPSASSLSSTKGSNVSRRMSNNLFGSGKFRDQAYIRTAGQGRRTGSATRTFSNTPTESSMSMSTVASSLVGPNMSMYSDSQSIRPTTPDGSTYSPPGSPPASPGKDVLFEKDAASKPTEFVSIERRLSKVLSPDGLSRATLALDAAIKELEEEGDDEIVMERSPITHVPSTPLSGTTAIPQEHGAASSLSSPTEYEPVTAVSADEPVVAENGQRSSPYPRARTTSPTPRLPGYIPGMPRPMTPRDPTFDADDLTPSSTPRATSPRLPGMNSASSSVMSSAVQSSLYRSSSSASSSRQSSRPSPSPVSPTAPLFFNRSINGSFSGRFTPDASQSSDAASPASELDSPTHGRRRPTSPLSGPAYQPLTTARPSTPSNVTWNMSNNTSPKGLGRSGSMSGRSRSDSTTSIPDVGSDTLERSKSNARSLRSPALPDSPWVDSGIAAVIQPEYRPPSAMSGMELGSPLQTNSRPLRSPTPTHHHSNGDTRPQRSTTPTHHHSSSETRSPTSPMFPELSQSSSSYTNGDSIVGSRRSSKQKHHSSFTLNSPHALLFSPFANSSRSSLESAGSSYHSWDEDHKKDRLGGFCKKLEPHRAEWHDLSGDMSSSSTPGTSPYEGLDVEETVRRQTGLTKSDFVAIQDKLVSAALMKANTPDVRNRANSIRRVRRPSTSQSNYSLGGDNRVASPAPQSQSSVDVASRAPNNDHLAKASLALLETVVHSIEAPAKPATVAPSSPALEQSTLSAPPMAQSLSSSPGRRHRALADMLFGAEEGAPPTPNLALQMPAGNTPSDSPVIPGYALGSPTTEFSPSLSPRTPARNLLTLDLSLGSPSDRPVPLPSASTTRVDATQLERDVQQRAEAATAALRKSPSIPKITEAGTVPRKKISPNQISSPTLVSASTRLDTVPLQPTSPSLQHQASSKKIGSRFKMLRGTLRAKPTMPNGEEITPYPVDFNAPPLPTSPVPTPSLSVISFGTQPEHSLPAPMDNSRLKPVGPTNPSPPSSAGPGLKGFMARFRKQRATEPYPAVQRQRSAAATVKAAAVASPPLQGSALEQSVQSAPPLRTEFAGLATPEPQAESVRPQTAQSSTSQAATERPPQRTDEDALKQLFDAASNLGLDQSALSDLIARSSSTSSKATRLGRMNSATESRRSHALGRRGDDSYAATSEGRPSVDGWSPRPSADFRQGTARRTADQGPQLRPEPTGEHSNAVVRRTIIFASDAAASGIDLGALVRKHTSSRRRRSASAASVHSARSIHDRVPTPPPHKSVGGRRFSGDTSPPVPQLPHVLQAHVEAPGVSVAEPVDQPISAHDSLYDMYAGDGRVTSTIVSDGHGSSSSTPYQNGETIPESGPALQVIEMANGETIWSIVNGLRDTDAESYYGDRASFVSEYSVRDRDSGGDGVKLFFKEHDRKSSKGSARSFLSQRKQQPLMPSNRPETKVFFSSTAQIGRLIEQLSRGMDAGSFNIAPEHERTRLGHSASSSVGSETWTMEERRVEQLLGSMVSP